MRQINKAGLDLIKSFEGLRLKAYKDAVGIWTVGYGHTKTATPGMAISEPEAEAMLRNDLAEAQGAVERLVKRPLNDNEYAALVSFVFNLGSGNLSRSTLLRKLNAGDRRGAADQFLVWNKAGGKVLAGLTRRRQAERALFTGGAKS